MFIVPHFSNHSSLGPRRDQGVRKVGNCCRNFTEGRHCYHRSSEHLRYYWNARHWSKWRVVGCLYLQSSVLACCDSLSDTHSLILASSSCRMTLGWLKQILQSVNHTEHFPLILFSLADGHFHLERASVGNPSCVWLIGLKKSITPVKKYFAAHPWEFWWVLTLVPSHE